MLIPLSLTLFKVAFLRIEKLEKNGKKKQKGGNCNQDKIFVIPQSLFEFLLEKLKDT